MENILSKNPFSGEILAEYSRLSHKELNEKLDRSAAAFVHWRNATLQEKSSFLLNAAAYLMENRDRFSKIISAEMGKPIRESQSEIEKCAWVCRYFAHHAADQLKDELIETEASKSYIKYQPLGAVLAIMPWNFPFWQVFRFAAPATMAGNVCLLKHASNVPQCSLAIEETFRESGFPLGVFQSLLIGNEQVEEVISNDIVVAVTLTGSEIAGSSVASQAGSYIKKTVLELGGSDPFIVLADADIDLAVNKAVTSRMINSGQSCIAAKRFLIHTKVYNEFRDKLVEKVLRLKLGDPMEPNTDIGCMARPDLALELWIQVEKSIAKGAKVISAGEKPKEESSIFHPVILEGVKPGMPVFDEEIFGPVVGLIEVENDEEAIELANKSRYGLGASIWTKDNEKGEKMAAKIESGAVFVNELVKSDPRLPFGGIKKSGYGRELSVLGIREFVNTKTIWID